MTSDAPKGLMLFLPPNEAKDTLDECKTTWVAPHLLKDPFEHSLRTTLGFDRSQLEKAVIARITKMVFNIDDPAGAGRDTPIQKAIRRWRNEDRFHSEEEVETTLVDVVPSLVGQHYDTIINHMGKWQSFATEVRMLRLFENLGCLQSWNELAQGHEGIAIKLQTGAETMVSELRPVSYKRKRKFHTAISDQVDIILGDMTQSSESHLFDRLLIKPYYLAEQKEWRAFYLTGSFKVQPDQPECDLVYRYDPNPKINPNALLKRGFEPSEVLAVYLGASIDQTLATDVVQICKSKFPKAKIYRGFANEEAFEVEFKKV